MFSSTESGQPAAWARNRRGSG